MKASHIAAISLAVAIVAAGLSAVVFMSKKEAVARAELAKAESEEAAAKKAAQKAELEASQARSRAAAKASEAKAAEENRKAKEAERETEALEAEKAESEAKRAAEARAEAEAKSAAAAAERDAKKAVAAAAKSEAVKARAAESAEFAKAEAAKAALEKERLASERIIAEAKIRETRLEELAALERELAELKLELDEREAALRPEKTVTNLVWTSQEDVVFDASGVARKVQKKVLLPENDPSIPPASRAFAKTYRIVAERNADLEAAVRSNVVSRLERLYRNALRDDRIVEAECYLSELKRMYPDWGKTKESK